MAIESNVIVALWLVVLEVNVNDSVVNEQNWECVMLVTVVDVRCLGIV